MYVTFVGCREMHFSGRARILWDKCAVHKEVDIESHQRNHRIVVYPALYSNGAYHTCERPRRSVVKAVHYRGGGRVAGRNVVLAFNSLFEVEKETHRSRTQIHSPEVDEKKKKRLFLCGRGLTFDEE